MQKRWAVPPFVHGLDSLHSASQLNFGYVTDFAEREDDQAARLNCDSSICSTSSDLKPHEPRISVRTLYVAMANLLKSRVLRWWRRGESEYSAVLKIRNLLIFQDAENVENAEIEPNWNVSGT